MFCVVQGYEANGFGKVINRSGNNWIVEYFDSPNQDGRLQLTVPKSSVILKRLGRNSRVYVFSELDNGWRVARVLEDDGEGMDVRFPHQKDGYINYADAFVRWKHPISNPVVYLARFITETPQYSQARSEFLQNYIDQRGAASGIGALLSSAVELEPHQIGVVRRVLNDPSQRYLLADEVGLGKTIEAGIIIRQAVLDNPKHKVAILVPSPLVRQWRQELISRFGMKVFLDDSVFVLPHAAGPEQDAALENASLVVVDEAHYVADPNGSIEIQRLYGLLQRESRRTERLLLVSATPIVRNEVGFLRMLHLLDPVVYPLSDYEGFKNKIVHRQALAEVVALLVPEHALFLEQPLEDLLERIPDDVRLHGLVGELKDLLLMMPEEDDVKMIAGIRRVRAHISETYRLNRRILRNRRKQIQGLTPDRSGADCCVVLNSQVAGIESALENWRVAAFVGLDCKVVTPASRALGDFYWELVNACIEDPGLLLQLCAGRRELPAWPKGQHEGRFDGEDEFLARIASLWDRERWLDARCAQLLEQLRLLSPKVKVVLFCTASSTADAVFKNLKTGNVSVVRHTVNLDWDADADFIEPWSSFLTDPGVRVIVCDRTAEEGLNLQGGDRAVIHFDVPFNPNRIEQRMGRVDRYGAGNRVHSYVLLDQAAPLQQAWFNLLQTGFGVFDHSISSLQYLVEDELARLKEHLFADGVEALQDLLARLTGPEGLVASEFKLIDQQDALDELSILSDVETEKLYEIDDDWKTIRHAMLSWIEDTLLFSAVQEPPRNGTTSIEHAVRLHYHPPESRNKATLIPLVEFLNDFLRAIDYEAPGSRASEPRSFVHMAHRTSAVRRGSQLMRYGDEFVEAVKAFSDIDDRGRSFALWRQWHHGFAPGVLKMYFRFDFLVETALTNAEAVMKLHLEGREGAAKSVLARRGDALFAPFIIQIWLDEDGDKVEQDQVERFLAPGYAKDGGVGYIDKNLGSEHFRALKRQDPDSFANWRERCFRMNECAHTLVLTQNELATRKTSALSRARAEDEVRHAQIYTRIQSLRGAEAEAEIAEFELERHLNDALYEGILNPSVKVDVAGVVFLTEQPISVLDAYIGVGQ